MILQEFLDNAIKQLSDAGIETARLDCLVLLEDCLHTDRAQLLAHPEQELSNEQQNVLNLQIERRINHEPIAYIRGKTEFYGREFTINKSVLEPRPETETMIDLLKKLPIDARKNIVDVGTGSGAIAITAALELKEVQVVAIDIDTACLGVARQNCEHHKATVNLLHGNLLEPLQALHLKPTATVLANLPYVPSDHTINQAAMMEPELAIFGGIDGLDLYREMFTQTDTLATRPGFVLTESLPFQHKELTEIAKSHGYQQQTEDDFIQVFTSGN